MSKVTHCPNCGCHLKAAPDLEVEAPKQAKTRGTRLPEDWEPTEKGKEYARSHGLDRRTLEDFRDYWCAKAGQGAIKVDWDRTWNMWCRNQATRYRTARQTTASNQSGLLKSMGFQPEGSLL